MDNKKWYSIEYHYKLFSFHNEESTKINNNPNLMNNGK